MRALVACALVVAGCASEPKEAPAAPPPPPRARGERCAMQIDGSSDLRIVSAMLPELARLKACRTSYRLSVPPVPPEREGSDLRLVARMTVFTKTGALAGEVPVSVALPGGALEPGGEARLYEAAGRRAARLFADNFRE